MEATTLYGSHNLIWKPQPIINAQTSCCIFIKFVKELLNKTWSKKSDFCKTNGLETVMPYLSG
jgi:hypothetical protein